MEISRKKERKDAVAKSRRLAVREASEMAFGS
jgi:hypothetical protein